MTISFEPGNASDINSPWGQVLSLLEKVARLPKEIYCDPFKMRGLKIQQHEYAEAMNVLDDVLLRGLPHNEPSQNECKRHLALIDEIMVLSDCLL